MRITIITQNDPFYLAENINYLMKNMPRRHQVVSCVVFDTSPFGKKESFMQKAVNTYRIFGLAFFAHYVQKYVISRFNPRTSVKRTLKKYFVPILELKSSINSKEYLELIKSFNPDVLLSIAGNQLFQKELINLAPKGCLNLHTALLPKYRGLMPSFWVLKNNEEYTGVSLFFVDEGIDSGPILVQKKVRIGDMTQEQLIRHTKRVGMDAVIEGIDMIEKGNYQVLKNDASQMTYYHFPARKDVEDFLARGKRFY
jgi:methionyl-tRNA formyltransferase